jgi:DNA-binding response OmpR family regulator
LAVDDNAWARRSVAAALPRECQFIGLADGSEFMDTVEAYEPDLVILHLPCKGGSSLTGRLRRRAEFRHIPVLFLTAMKNGAAFRRLLEADGDAYLTMPFDARVLRETIVQLLGGMRSSRRQRSGNF